MKMLWNFLMSIVQGLKSKTEKKTKTYLMRKRFGDGLLKHDITRRYYDAQTYL